MALNEWIRFMGSLHATGMSLFMESSPHAEASVSFSKRSDVHLKLALGLGISLVGVLIILTALFFLVVGFYLGCRGRVTLSPAISNLPSSQPSPDDDRLSPWGLSVSGPGSPARRVRFASDDTASSTTMTVPPPTPSSNPPSSPISPKFLTADDFASEHDHDKVDPPLLPRIGDTLPRGFIPTNFTPNNPSTALEPAFQSPFRVSHLTPPSQFQLIDTPMSVQYPSVTPMAKVSQLTGYAPYPTDNSQDAQHSPLPIYTKSPPNASHYTKLPSPVRLPPLTPLVQQSSLSPRARHIQSFPPLTSAGIHLLPPITPTTPRNPFSAISKDVDAVHDAAQRPLSGLYDGVDGLVSLKVNDGGIGEARKVETRTSQTETPLNDAGDAAHGSTDQATLQSTN